MFKNIIHITISFIVGCVLTAGIGYFYLVGPSDNRIKQYRTEQLELKQNNLELENRLRARQEIISGLQFENNNLTDRLRTRQAYLTEAGQIITSSGESIQKLRELFVLLKKAQ